MWFVYTAVAHQLILTPSPLPRWGITGATTGKRPHTVPIRHPAVLTGAALSAVDSCRSDIWITNTGVMLQIFFFYYDIPDGRRKALAYKIDVILAVFGLS
ncbi:hypothetical protein E2C01_007138 [Portunus trituberculatus]|uniref:Uncharacterized protein n=1 Tax=Portunus trituberculatus TaxID=210409 RepID=A0A5B7CZ98_PORTR|nr:hypothetical protein [Portunus trituberculatus]